MTASGWTAIVLGSAVVVLLWATSTPRRRDELARDFARQVFLVDGIADRDVFGDHVRALVPFLARSARGSTVVLARAPEQAAELVAVEEGEQVAISTLLGRHRVVRIDDRRWAVAVLPRWLGFLGKTSS